MGLGGETNLNNVVLLSRQLIQQHIRNVFSLACTGGTNNKRWNILINTVFLDVGVADLIHSGNSNILHNGVFRELVNVLFVGEVVPRLPRILFELDLLTRVRLIPNREVNIIEAGASVHAAGDDFTVVEFLDVVDFTIADFFKVDVDRSSELGVDGGADCPNERPNEAAVDD